MESQERAYWRAEILRSEFGFVLHIRLVRDWFGVFGVDLASLCLAVHGRCAVARDDSILRKYDMLFLSGFSVQVVMRARGFSFGDMLCFGEARRVEIVVTGFRQARAAQRC